MSRQPVLTGFLPHAHGHPHPHQLPLQHQAQHQHQHHGQQGHYGSVNGVAALSHYEGVVHSGLAFARPLPIRAPVLAPAAFTHQHTGQLQHLQVQHGRDTTPSLTMADPSAYMPSDEELAHLQKLSSEYEPEATVSSVALPPSCLLVCCHSDRR